MDIFENILTGEKSSKYRTNHFHMFVDDDVCIPEVQNMSDSAFGTLMHEYSHYIQHITTLFGIRICDIFHKMSIIYREYILEHDVIQLPLCLWENDEHLSQFLVHFNNVSGCKSCNFHIDAVDINESDIELARANKSAVKIGCYDFENNKVYESGFNFGYVCVMESMAHEIQKILTPDIFHPEIPYCAAELILREYYPEISKDSRLIASICYCALHWDNPGVGFFEVVNIAKRNPALNGIELYKHIAQDYSVSFKGKSMPRYRLIVSFLLEFIKNLEQVIGNHLDYYKSVMENCIDEACSSTSRLLEVLYNIQPNDKKALFNSLTGFYGYPVIDAKNYTFLPKKVVDGRERPYLETAVLFGWELILTRLLEINGNKECDRLPICSKSIYSNPEQCKVSEFCRYAPWNNTEECPFTQCMKYYKFNDKKLIESN